MKTAQGAPAQEEERIAASMAYIQHSVAGRHLCSAVQQLRQRFAVSVIHEPSQASGNTSVSSQ